MPRMVSYAPYSRHLPNSTLLRNTAHVHHWPRAPWTSLPTCSLPMAMQCHARGLTNASM
ncbi:hypothetical protein BGW80DRAFT_1334360 [Lactifluus volemus]|nr:hypothetical protein BGW80DRAFT_1334360 [Lactifluus volemus]